MPSLAEDEHLLEVRSEEGLWSKESLPDEAEAKENHIKQKQEETILAQQDHIQYFTQKLKELEKMKEHHLREDVALEGESGTN